MGIKHDIVAINYYKIIECVPYLYTGLGWVPGGKLPSLMPSEFSYPPFFSHRCPHFRPSSGSRSGLIPVLGMNSFIRYYNYRRYHEGLRNVTPCDVYTGKHHEIIQRRKKVKSRTLAERRNYNRSARRPIFCHSGADNQVMPVGWRAPPALIDEDFAGCGAPFSC